MDSAKAISRDLFKIITDVKRVRHRIARDTGLNLSEFELLCILFNSREPLSIKEASSELLLCSQAVTKIAKSLNAKGLLVYEKSDADRRVTQLKLTREGRQIAEREAAARQRFVDEALQNITFALTEDVQAFWTDLSARTRELTRDEPALDITV